MINGHPVARVLVSREVDMGWGGASGSGVSLLCAEVYVTKKFLFSKSLQMYFISLI
jgi:hypothetical protein